MQSSFFTVCSVAEVFSLLRQAAPLALESIPLDMADGRVLAEPLVAPHDLPMAHRACMDGFAVHAESLFGASEGNPAYLDCDGQSSVEAYPCGTLPEGHCLGVVTGGILPKGANAVLMQEYTQQLGASCVEARRSVAPWEHVMLQGEDVAEGETILPARVRLRPQEVGMLAALGVANPLVYKQPRVAIISTGDEIIPVEKKAHIGLTRDVNSYTLSALSRHAGCISHQLGIVGDNAQQLRNSIDLALHEYDVVFLSGGSSVGMRDLMVEVLLGMGADILCHGVAMSPGKPLIIATLGKKYVWGLPGQVTSAHIVMLILGMPFLRHLGGEQKALCSPTKRHYQARLGRNIASVQGRDDYVRVRIIETDGDSIPCAMPVLGKSGLLKTLIKSDGVVCIPAGSEGLEQGTLVDVLLFTNE